MADQFQLRGHSLEVWLRKNPIVADRELVIIPDENTFAIGNGKDRFSSLVRRPFGADAWEVLVKYGGYKGTREDFCRQLSDTLRMPEQQAGTLTNAGAGWNSFTFPREFVEECFVILTPQSTAVRFAVKNTTKRGFHYILHDANGDTTTEPILVNWMATAVSELNMAQAIAKLAGLDPFVYDNLTAIFADHAAEVVINEAAYSMVKRSAMASARYLCFLCNLSHDSYYNMVSIAENVTAMNAIASTEAAVAFVNSASGAYDSVRLNSMAVGKYLAGLLSMSPVTYLTVTDVLNDSVALAALVVDQTAMEALCASFVAAGELAAHETACSAVASSDIAMTAVASSDIAMTAVASSDIAMTAVASSDIAMTAVASSDIAYNAIYNNSDAYATLLSVKLAMDTIAGSRAAITALIGDAFRCQKLAASNVAMDAVAASNVAMDAVAASNVARDAIQKIPSAMKVVTDSNSFIAKYAIGCLGSASYKPENFANMAAIVANSGALTALAASATAMNALAASATARDILYKNSTSWNILSKVDMAIAKYAIGCLNNSSYKPANFASMSSVISNSAALAALANSSTAMSALAKSSTAKNALITKNDILQSVRLKIWNTVKSDSSKFTLSRAQKDDDTVTSANITGANYIVFAIPGSYGTAAESKKTTMFHGHNAVQVIQRWGSYADESEIYVGLGGATFTEQGDGMVRTWVYTVN